MRTTKKIRSNFNKEMTYKSYEFNASDNLYEQFNEEIIKILNNSLFQYEEIKSISILRDKIILYKKTINLNKEKYEFLNLKKEDETDKLLKSIMESNLIKIKKILDRDFLIIEKYENLFKYLSNAEVERLINEKLKKIENEKINTEEISF